MVCIKKEQEAGEARNGSSMDDIIDGNKATMQEPPMFLPRSALRKKITFLTCPRRRICMIMCVVPQLGITLNLIFAITSGCSFISAMYSPVSRISGRVTSRLSNSLEVCDLMISIKS